ncbi:hypothetical protein P4S88_13260 [Anoxybacillus geothermalis]|nr:hypothetical protein [Anoxybacillus geothermalis]
MSATTGLDVTSMAKPICWDDSPSRLRSAFMIGATVTMRKSGSLNVTIVEIHVSSMAVLADFTFLLTRWTNPLIPPVYLIMLTRPANTYKNMMMRMLFVCIKLSTT